MHQSYPLASIIMAGQVDGQVLPDGIFSILDTDLYKLTMQCAILKYLPDVREYCIVRRVVNADDSEMLPTLSPTEHPTCG